jgi:hypothetical protein
MVHGSSSQAAQEANRTVIHVQSPDNSTSGLLFDGNWEVIQSLGDSNDVKSGMMASTPLSRATYRFVGKLLFPPNDPQCVYR